MPILVCCENALSSITVVHFGRAHVKNGTVVYHLLMKVKEATVSVTF